LGNTGRLFTVGFSKTAERQYAVFDPKNMGSPLVEPTGKFPSSHKKNFIGSCLSEENSEIQFK